MTLKTRITDDMKAAMRARDTARLSTIRLLLAAIKQREVDERRELADGDIVTVLDRMVKQRRDSISQFEAGKRLDLAEIERAEVAILEGYLPSRLSESEIDAAIEAAIARTGAVGAAGMGKVMGVLKGELAGRADLGVVSARVKARLG
jgi:uncharacterized protein YqeY